MKFGIITAARLSPYDRTRTKQAFAYDSVGVAPHGITQRYVYTVPAARRMRVEAHQVWFQRQTAAAPVGQIQANNTWTSFLGFVYQFPVMRMTDNTVLAERLALFASQFDYEAGSILQGQTSDASTGGTVAYYLSFGGQEYDA